MTSRGASCVSLSMEAFSAAIDAFLDKEICPTHSSRYSQALELAEQLRCRLGSPECAWTASIIVSAVNDCVKQALGVASSAARREKASVVFREVSLTILPLHWESLFANIGIAAEDPLLPQSINDYLFENAFCREFAVAQGGTSIDRTITDNEMNALRYMSGFIPHKLLRKYRLADSPKSREFCFLLEQLRDNFFSTAEDDSF